MKTDRIATKLQLKVENGMNTAGEMKFKYVDFTRINQSLSNDVVLEIGHGIASLMEKDAHDVYRVDTDALGE